MRLSSTGTNRGDTPSGLPDAVQDIFAGTFECIARVDYQGCFLTVNGAYADVCGYGQEEMIGMPWRETVHPDDLELVEKKFREVLETGRSDTEIRGLRKNRSVFYMQLLIVKGLESDTSSVHHYCFINDITARVLDELTVLKSVKEGLELQEQKFLTLISDIPGVVFQTDVNDYWSFSYLGPGIEKLLGIPAHRLLSTGSVDYASLVHEDDRERVKEIIDSAVSRQESYLVEYRIIRSDGQLRWVSEKGTSDSTETGGQIRIGGIIRDITDLKRSEQQLRIVQTQIDTAGDLVICLDGKDRLTYVNNAACTALGHGKDGLLGAYAAEVCGQLLSETIKPYLIRSRSGLDGELDGWFRLPDDIERYYKIKLHPVSEEDATGGTLIVMRDITGTLDVQEAVKEAESRFQTVIDSSTDIMIITSFRDGEIRAVNNTFTKITGYETKEVIGRKASNFYLNPEDRDLLVNELNLHGFCANLETRMIARDGHIVTGLLTSSLIQFNNEPCVITATRDISEQKHVDAELARKNRLIALLQKITFEINRASSIENALQTVLDEIFHYCNWSLGHAYILENTGGQLESRHLWTSEPALDFAGFRKITEQPDSVPGSELTGRILADEKPVWIEELFQGKDYPGAEHGTELGIKSAFGFPVLSGGKVVAVLEFFNQNFSARDENLLEGLTPVGLLAGVLIEQRQSAMALKQSRINFNKAVNASPDSIIIIRLDDGRILDVNDAVIHVTGYSREELIETGNGLMFWTDEQACREHARAIKRKGHVANYSMLTRRKDGSTIPCLMSSTLINVDGEKCTFSIVKDVSDLAFAYEEILDKEKQVKVVTDSAAVFISYVDTDLRYVFNNMDFHEQLEIDSSSIVGRTIPEVIGDRRYKQIEPYISSALKGEDVQFELEITNASGENFYFEITYHPDRKDGSIQGIYIASSDITQRKTTEFALVRTNRALRVLNQCSQLLVEQRNEDDLLQAVCDIVINEGGYQVAWLGCTDREKNVDIRRAGYAVNRQYGPAETGAIECELPHSRLLDDVMASGNPLVIRKAKDDVFDLHIRDGVTKESQMSTLGLPLRLREKILGVMVITSWDEEAFDEEEIKLLASMAENIGYGIQSIREKAKRKNAEKLLALENQVFETTASSPGLPGLLNELAIKVESLLTARQCSVFLPSDDRRFLINVAAPSIEESYITAITSLEVDQLPGPCGRAYQLNKRIVIEDTSMDPVWKDHCQLESMFRLVSCCVTPIADADGQVQGLFCLYATQPGTPDDFELQVVDRMTYIIGGAIANDKIAQALKENEERFALAMDGSQDGMWDLNLETSKIYLSPRWKNMLGYAEHELENEVSTFFKLLHPDDMNIQEKMLGDNTGSIELEFRMKHKEGHYVDILSRAKGIRRNPGGDITRIVGTHVDLTERNQTAQRIRESERRFRELYDDSPSMFLTLDQSGLIQSINRYGADHLGYTVDSLLGKSASDITHAEDDIVLRQKLKACIDNPKSVQRCEIRKLHKYGDAIWVRATMRSTGMHDDKKNVLVTCEDISEARILSEQLEYQANHDSLTGLINRFEFEKRLRRVLNNDSEDTDHALCYLDLDQFKIINDTCGHLAGDELLRRVSDILNTVVRKRDTLARMGGDEFAVLLEHCPLEQAMRVANELLRSIETLRFVWEDKLFTLSVSIGLVPMRGGSGVLTDILSAADEACYAAKDSGRNRVHVYHSDDLELNRRRGEMEWVSRINQALEEDRFCLNAQIISSLGTARGKLRGDHYEILVRMQGEGSRLILPGAFLPAAERYNLSEKIDQWVVSKTLEWLSRNREIMSTLSVCSINLSGHSMGDDAFLDFLLGEFGRHSVPAEKICFEITETAAIANLGAAIQFIHALKEIGCLFALDDFGTGVSSFNYLKNLPVDYLKIDGSFIREINRDPIDFAMVRSINEIGQVMGKQTIAEFVETDEILRIVRKMGIDHAQGYALGRPEPLKLLQF